MKKLSKVLVLVRSTIMVLAMSASVFAADPVTGSITITPPTGVADDATNTYKIYKVFDAAGNGTAISYKVMESKKDVALPAGFVTDAAGNVIHGTKAEDGTVTPSTATELSADEIAAIKAYIGNDSPIKTATSTGSNPAIAENLPNGYYYITTSTGTVVTIDSTNPNAEVDDKNTVPTLDKKAKQLEDSTYVELDAAGKEAVAQVGQKVGYEATITVGKGAKGYVFHDKMDDGLSYNNDVKVFIGEDEVAATNYDKTPLAEGDTITLTFHDDYTKTLTEGTKLVVKYTATVTSAALSVNPATNTATLDYGDENSNNRTPETKVEVYNAKVTVIKVDGENAPLEGAGFVIKSGNKFYKIENNVVSWVDSKEAATEVFTAKAEGATDATAVFTGLGSGSYTLVEKTVPDGYNQAPDKEFTISVSDENLELEFTIENKAGSELPTTGGIGTTIFYVLGSLLVVGCGIVLVSRKRMQNNK